MLGVSSYNKLSQETLADMAQVSQGMISDLESGKHIPNAIILFRIAEALKVDINELFSDDMIIQNNSDKAIGNIRSQVTINNLFPENVMDILLANQQKMTALLEAQNKLLESIIQSK